MTPARRGPRTEPQNAGPDEPRRDLGTGDVGRPGDSGMVTAEAAVVLPVLVLVAAIAVAMVGAAATLIRAGDAAHTVALAAARGDPTAAQLGYRVLPGSQVAVVRAGGRVEVRVSASTRIGPFPGPEVSARAVAPDESDLSGSTSPASSAGRAAVQQRPGTAGQRPVGHPSPGQRPSERGT